MREVGAPPARRARGTGNGDERLREEQKMAMNHLGGYDPEAGRSAHEAHKPTLIPVPSLLRSLLSDHLDPGYQAAADAKKQGKHRKWWQAWAWQITGALTIAVVFAAAVAQARSTAPGVRESQQVLSGSVRSWGEKADAGMAAWNAPGVNAVRNDIAVVGA